MEPSHKYNNIYCCHGFNARTLICVVDIHAKCFSCSLDVNVARDTNFNHCHVMLDGPII